MTHIVTENCIQCKHTECVDICPVDCFKETPLMLVIDPDECIDCAVCVSACPTNAIYAEEDVPQNQEKFIKVNSFFSKRKEVNSITKRKEPLGTAKAWLHIENKIQYLELDFDALLISLQKDLQNTDGSLRANAVNCLDTLTPEQIESALMDSESIVRKTIAKREDFLPTSDQFSRGLLDITAEVRAVFFGLKKVSLSGEQIELGLNDNFELVRCITLNRNFVPSKSQFLRHVKNQNTTEQALMWGKLDRFIFDEIAENQNNSILIRAIREFREPLLSDDINKLLKNKDFNVIVEILDRSIKYPADCLLNSEQIDNFLTHTEEKLRIKLLDKYANKLTPGQIERCLKDSVGDVRRVAVSLKKKLLSPEQVESALVDESEIVRIEVLKVKKLVLTTNQVDRALRDSSDEVRLAVVRNNQNLFTSNQIDFLLRNGSEAVLLDLLSRKYLSISEDQYNYINLNCSIFIRKKVVEKIGFTPSIKQILQGLSDECVDIRYEFRKFIGSLDNETLLNNAIKGYSLITCTFTDSIEDTLERMQILDTWTTEKKALKDKLIEQLKEANYVFFNTSSRTALISNVGESCLYDVPLKKRGGLTRFAGKRVRLVCVGHERYSSVIIAAQSINDLRSD